MGLMILREYKSGTKSKATNNEQQALKAKPPTMNNWD